jgi:hypothetical protein
MDTIGALKRTLSEATQQAVPLYASKQPIHEMFANLRGRVANWLTAVNKDTVHRMYDDACQASRNAATRLRTDGQKQDVGQLVGNAIAASQHLLSDFDSAWGQFLWQVRGPLDRRRERGDRRTASRGGVLDRFWRDVESLDLPGVIRVTGEDIARCESITLDRLTDDQKRQLRDLLHSRLEELESAIRSMDMSVWERFRF